MKKLIIINVIVISVCAYSLPTTSTENVIEKNTSCDVLLDFSNMGLNIINRNFISNPFIKSLALRDNKIDSLQENTFDSLPSLEKLDLSNNELSTEKLFSFGNVNTLKSLILDYNSNSLSTSSDINYNKASYTSDRSYRTTPYPYYYSYTTQSYPKKCSEDQYKTDDGICKYYSELTVKYEYPSLTNLSMRKIFINSLASDWANHFPKLCHLDMSENHFEKTSKEVFSRLPGSLTSLTMQNVELTALESSNLKNITHLDLNDNRFETLSSHYCYENTLCLRNLTNLESLHVAKCSIKKIEIDAFKDAEKLNHLVISSNEFEEIPDGTFEYLSALTYLDLSKNKLNIMPNFSNLQNLTSLYMDDIYNKWLFTTALETFEQLPELQVLSLRWNELTQIPPSFLNKLPKLIELNLSNNNIAVLPPWQWQINLRRLLLDYNQIAELDDVSLKEAESLEVLSLRGNIFTEIKLKSLKYLPDDVILKL